MKKVDQIQRDSDIYVASIRGFPPKSLARQHGLCEDRVRQIIKEEASRQPSPFEHPAIDHIQDALDGYDRDMGDLAVIALLTQNQRVKVSAIRTKMRARDRKLKLLEQLGLLPVPGRISALSYRELDRTFREILRRHNASLELQEELSGALNAWAKRFGLGEWAKD